MASSRSSPLLEKDSVSQKEQHSKDIGFVCVSLGEHPL